MLAFLLGHLEWIVPAVGVVGVLGSLAMSSRAREARPDPEGGLVLVDQQDTGIGVLSEAVSMLGFGAVAFVIATFLLFTTPITDKFNARGFVGNSSDLGLLAIIALLALLGLLAVVQVLHRTRTMLRLAPGELRVPIWPLPAHQGVTVEFSRIVRGEAALNSLSARLVLYRTVRRKNDTTRRAVEQIPLGAGASRLRQGRLTASWELPVPAALPQTGNPLMLAIAAALRPQAELEWVLEVRPDFEGLSDDDSVFPLVITER